MTSPRPTLPQLDGSIFLTGGGLETALIFLEGVELPEFAAFPLLLNPQGRERLEHYFEPFIRAAVDRKLGFILGTPTWRANADWGARLGYSPEVLAAVNRAGAAFASGLKRKFETAETRIVVDGVIGPRGDGYRIDQRMSADEAQAYHAAQVSTFCDTEAQMVSAITMTYAQEAVGIVKAARERGMPVVVSFTLGSDGRLPNGEALGAAIEIVDEATDGAPAYYMINCAHPSHFEAELFGGGSWLDRIRGLRANASSKSHAELDEARDLDAGDPLDLAERYRRLRGRMQQLSILGGCCGTDHRHVEAICEACLA